MEQSDVDFDLKFYLRVFVLGVESRAVRKVLAPFRMYKWDGALEKSQCSFWFFFLFFSVLAILMSEYHLAFAKRVEQI